MASASCRCSCGISNECRRKSTQATCIWGSVDTDLLGVAECPYVLDQVPRGLVGSSKESKLSSVALPVMIQRTTCVSCAAMYRRELSVHLASDSQGFPSSL